MVPDLMPLRRCPRFDCARRIVMSVEGRRDVAHGDTAKERASRLVMGAQSVSAPSQIAPRWNSVGTLTDKTSPNRRRTVLNQIRTSRYWKMRGNCRAESTSAETAPVQGDPQHPPVHAPSPDTRKRA